MKRIGFQFALLAVFHSRNRPADAKSGVRATGGRPTQYRLAINLYYRVASPVTPS
jgi:hypothetical protein